MRKVTISNRSGRTITSRDAVELMTAVYSWGVDYDEIEDDTPIAEFVWALSEEDLPLAGTWASTLGLTFAWATPAGQERCLVCGPGEGHNQ